MMLSGKISSAHRAADFLRACHRKGGQVRTENTVDTELVRGSNKEFAGYINLKASRFSDVNVSVDHHAVRISKPALNYFVNRQIQFVCIKSLGSNCPECRFGDGLGRCPQSFRRWPSWPPSALLPRQLHVLHSAVR